jgi:hypothetical protein
MFESLRICWAVICIANNPALFRRSSIPLLCTPPGSSASPEVGLQSSMFCSAASSIVNLDIAALSCFGGGVVSRFCRLSATSTATSDSNSNIFTSSWIVSESNFRSLGQWTPLPRFASLLAFLFRWLGTRIETRAEEEVDFGTHQTDVAIGRIERK